MTNITKKSIFSSTNGNKEIRLTTFKPNSSFKGQVNIIKIKINYGHNIKLKTIKPKTHFQKFTHPLQCNFKKVYCVSSILEI